MLCTKQSIIFYSANIAKEYELAKYFFCPAIPQGSCGRDCRAWQRASSAPTSRWLVSKRVGGALCYLPTCAVPTRPVASDLQSEAMYYKDF